MISHDNVKSIGITAIAFVLSVSLTDHYIMLSNYVIVSVSLIIRVN